MDLKKIGPLLGQLPPHKQAAVKARTAWLQRARQKQVPPHDIDWFVFIALAGRGFGKSLLASNEAWWHAAWNDGARVAVVAPTAGDLRRTCFEGESGILSQVPAECLQGGDQAVAYNRSLFELRFENGSVIQGYSAAEPDRLRGPNHGFAICLVGDTAVTMGDGSSKPIKAVRAGDMVMTRAGPRRVLASAMTNPSAEVLKLTTSCDTVVLGTTKHLFYTPSRGFVPLGELRKGDALCQLTESNGTAASGGSAITGTTTTAMASSTIGLFTRRITARSRQGGLSTMMTRTKATTTQRTSSPSRSGNTPRTTTRDGRTQTQNRASRHYASSGTNAQSMTPPAPLVAPRSKLAPSQVGNGSFAARHAWSDSEATHSSPSVGPAIAAAKPISLHVACKGSVLTGAIFSTEPPTGRLRLRFRSPAPNAPTCSSLNDPTQSSAVGLAPSLSTATVQTVERCATPQPVYDLTVEGEAEFFANGLLVHNCDEIAAWSEAQHCWDMLTMTLRIGARPQVIATTTPRPVPIIRDLLKRAGRDVYVVRGSTFENEENLAPSFLAQLRARYAGTRLGRQELEAELLDDVPGALWTRAMLDACQIRDMPPRLPPRHSADYRKALAEGLSLARIVVGVDPSGASGNTDRADEIGIVVAGVDHHGRGYVLEDASAVYSPEAWGRKTVEMYEKWGADRIVAEGNFGGHMVTATIRATSRNAPVVLVTASRGKSIRAEPVAALYEQGKITHADYFPKLEEQLAGFTRTGYHGEGSPDHADSCIWAITDLMLSDAPVYDVYSLTGIRPPGT